MRDGDGAAKLHPPPELFVRAAVINSVRNQSSIVRLWLRRLAGLGLGSCLVLAVGAEESLEKTESTPDNLLPTNPYSRILVRNAFALKEPLPPPPPPTNPPPVVEPVKIDVKLAGLGEIKGVRWAYLIVPDPATKGQFLYPSLTDDPKRGRVRMGDSLEVKEINLRKKSVRVVNGGVEATLNFADNGVKGTGPSSVGGKPGVPPPPGGAPNTANLGNRGNSTVVVPAAFQTGDHRPDPVPAQPVVFSRNANRANANSGGGGTGFVPINSALPPAATTPAPSVSFPTRPLRVDPNTVVHQVPSIPVEQQYEVLLRQRQAAENAGIQLPPIPGMPSP